MAAMIQQKCVFCSQIWLMVFQSVVCLALMINMERTVMAQAVFIAGLLRDRSLFVGLECWCDDFGGLILAGRRMGDHIFLAVLVLKKKSETHFSHVLGKNRSKKISKKTFLGGHLFLAAWKSKYLHK